MGTPLRIGPNGQVPDTPTTQKAEELRDLLQTLCKVAQTEMDEIEALAKELRGDPEESSRYLYAQELQLRARGILDILDGKHTFTRAAKNAGTGVGSRLHPAQTDGFPYG